MFDQTAIQELSRAQAIGAANTALDAGVRDHGGPHGIVALPQDYQVHDLERNLDQRRRARGTMTTASVDDFTRYVEAHAEDGASVFIDPDKLHACAVLNLGTPDIPGHADNLAVLTPRHTAAHLALTNIATGMAHPQVRVAEWMEDWLDLLRCFHDDAEIEAKHAVAAVRQITVEAMRQVKSGEQQLSANRSTFETVRASSGTEHHLPTHIHIACEPVHGLAQRTFVLRVSVLTEPKPAIALRIVKAEEHAEQMAAELRGLVRAALEDCQADTCVTVLVGQYKAGA